MSATNRGTTRKEADFYATPIETVYLLLDNYKNISPHDSILEPGAGNGNVIRALRDRGFANYISAIEVRKEEKTNLKEIADTVIISDFLHSAPELKKCDVIIGNPPYSHAKEFIDKSLSLLNPGGRLIFLLRTNFLESRKRFEWWQDKLPTKLFVLSKRPSFTGKGTDATSYSWFIWEKDIYADRFINSQEIKII